MEVSARYGTWFQPAWRAIKERAPKRYQPLLLALGRGGVETFVSAQLERREKKRPPFWITGPGWHDKKIQSHFMGSAGGADVIPSFKQINLQLGPGGDLPAPDDFVVAMMLNSGGNVGATQLYRPVGAIQTEHVSGMSTSDEQAVRLDQLAQDFLSAKFDDPYHSAFFGILSAQPLDELVGDKLEGSVTQRRLMSGGKLIGWMMAEQCVDAPTILIEHWVYQCAQPPTQLNFHEIQPDEIASSRGSFYALAGQTPARWVTRIGIHGIAPPPVRY